MGVNEGEETFVFLSFPEKLECDAARADRTNHGRHFDRRFILSEGNFQVKNVVDMHLGFALDDAPSQGEIHHRPFASHFPAGK
jgi:hypothetical protein